MSIARRRVAWQVVQMRHRHGYEPTAGHRDAGPDRGTGQSQVEPLDVGRDERRAHECRVAVFRPASPSADALVASLAGRPDQAILLEDIDDFLEPEDIGLERRHVGEDQGQALVPAVGQVADVERGDLEAHSLSLTLRHPARRAGRR